MILMVLLFFIPRRDRFLGFIGCGTIDTKNQNPPTSLPPIAAFLTGLSFIILLRKKMLKI